MRHLIRLRPNKRRRPNRVASADIAGIALAHMPGVLQPALIRIEQDAMVFSFRWIGRGEPEMPAEYLEQFGLCQAE